MQWQQLLTVDRHVPRSFDPKADLAAVDVDHRNTDVISDKNLFPELATEY